MAAPCQPLTTRTTGPTTYTPSHPTPLPTHSSSAGDLGGYKFRPGSRECFQRGRDYLQSFNLPTTLVTGNHE